MPHKGFILRRSVPDLNTMDSGFARVDSDTANLEVWDSRNIPYR